MQTRRRQGHQSNVCKKNWALQVRLLPGGDRVLVAGVQGKAKDGLKSRREVVEALRIQEGYVQQRMSGGITQAEKDRVARRFFAAYVLLDVFDAVRPIRRGSCRRSCACCVCDVASITA